MGVVKADSDRSEFDCEDFDLSEIKGNKLETEKRN
jgi:hypothetical protein